MRAVAIYRAVVSAAVASLGVAVTCAVAAHASHVVCGQTITVSTTLDSNVTGCTNNGIVIGADNVTLDLAGFTISGSADPLDGAGVLSANHTGVTITGPGTISGFDAGVVVQGGSRNTVRSLNVRGNVGRINHPTLANSPYGDGILILDSSSNNVIQNVVKSNGPLSGIGLRGNADDNLIQGNKSENNIAALDGPNADNSTMEDMGFRLDGAVGQFPNRNRLIGNTARKNGQDGFAVGSHADDNTLMGNYSTENGQQGAESNRGSGFKLFGQAFRTTVSGNRATLNALHGIYIAPTIALPPAELGNVIMGNTALNNAFLTPTVFGYDLIDGNRFCFGDTWSNNVHETENNPGTDCVN